MTKGQQTNVNQILEMAEAVAKLMPQEQLIGVLNNAGKEVDNLGKQAKNIVANHIGDGAKAAHNAIDDAAKQMNKGLNEVLGGIENEAAKKALAQVGQGAINMGQQLANNAVDELNVQGSKAIENLIGRMLATVKIVLDDVGSWITGEKNRQQAFEGIQNSWQEAGKNMETKQQTARVERTSKIEEILEQGGKKGQDNKGFAAQVAEQKSARGVGAQNLGG